MKAKLTLEFSMPVEDVIPSLEEMLEDMLQACLSRGVTLSTYRYTNKLDFDTGSHEIVLDSKSGEEMVVASVTVEGESSAL